MLSEKLFFRLLHAAGISSLKPTSPCAARTQFRSKLRYGGVYWTQLELTFCRETIPTPFPAVGNARLIGLRLFPTLCRRSSLRFDPRLRSVLPVHTWQNLPPFRSRERRVHTQTVQNFFVREHI
jgi:hypothetical protein